MWHAVHPPGVTVASRWPAAMVAERIARELLATYKVPQERDRVVVAWPGCEVDTAAESAHGEILAGVAEPPNLAAVADELEKLVAKFRDHAEDIERLRVALRLAIGMKPSA